MSTYFINTDQAETNEIFECMDSHTTYCDCGETYCLFDIYDYQGETKKDIFVVCDCCTKNNPKESYF